MYHRKTKVNIWNMFIYKLSQPHTNTMHFCKLGWVSIKCQAPTKYQATVSRPWAQLPQGSQSAGRPRCQQTMSQIWWNNWREEQQPLSQQMLVSVWRYRAKCDRWIAFTCQRRKQHSRKGSQVHRQAGSASAVSSGGTTRIPKGLQPEIKLEREAGAMLRRAWLWHAHSS